MTRAESARQMALAVVAAAAAQSATLVEDLLPHFLPFPVHLEGEPTYTPPDPDLNDADREFYRRLLAENSVIASLE